MKVLSGEAPRAKQIPLGQGRLRRILRVWLSILSLGHFSLLVPYLAFEIVQIWPADYLKDDMSHFLKITGQKSPSTG